MQLSNVMYSETMKHTETRDATIPFLQIRSDPENSEYRRFRSDPILAQCFFFLFFNQCRVSILLCHSFVC